MICPGSLGLTSIISARNVDNNAAIRHLCWPFVNIGKFYWKILNPKILGPSQELPPGLPRSCLTRCNGLAGVLLVE